MASRESSGERLWLARSLAGQDWQARAVARKESSEEDCGLPGVYLGKTGKPVLWLARSLAGQEWQARAAASQESSGKRLVSQESSGTRLASLGYG